MRLVPATPPTTPPRPAGHLTNGSPDCAAGAERAGWPRGPARDAAREADAGQAAPAIPTGQLYEPKWDGFRSIIFRDGDEVEIGSRNERPMTRYFPEVVEAVLANFPERAVIDGEIVVLDRERNALEFEVLQQRIHPAASRVNLLAEQTPASFVAFDLLALGDEDLTEPPVRASAGPGWRRRWPTAEPPVHVTPITDDHDLAADLVRPVRGRRPRRADRQEARPAPTSPTSA